MEFKVGDRVRNLSNPNWGISYVEESGNTNYPLKVNWNGHHVSDYKTDGTQLTGTVFLAIVTPLEELL